MDDLDIQILFDDIAEDLFNKRGMDPDDIEEYLVAESERVAQELRDSNLKPARARYVEQQART